MPTTWYFCDICGDRHRTLEAAVACEAKGKAPQLPAGVFCHDVPQVVRHPIAILQVFTGEGSEYGHSRQGSCWTFRDSSETGKPAIGDSSPQQKEATSGPWAKATFRTPDIDTSTHRYLRAWTSMRRAGIRPTYARDGQLIDAPVPTPGDETFEWAVELLAEVLDDAQRRATGRDDSTPTAGQPNAWRLVEGQWMLCGPWGCHPPDDACGEDVDRVTAIVRAIVALDSKHRGDDNEP